MADFDDELNGYLQARTASEQKEKQDIAAANAAADALFGAFTSNSTSTTATTTTSTVIGDGSSSPFTFPHPDGFQATKDQPAFAFHAATQLWHDAYTGTYSYYDAATETYIPVEAPNLNSLNSSQQQQQQQQQQKQGQQHYYYHQHHQQAYGPPNSSNMNGGMYHIDPHTGYAIELNQYASASAATAQPPESDATLRLCVLSSNILKVGGVIIMDASGLSFGRDRPLSGQGNRVRMVEMEISRFHASIYLDRQQVHPHQQSDGQGQLEQRQHHRQQYQHQQQSQKKQYDEVENEQYTPQTQGSMKHKSLPPAADTPNKPSQSDMSTEVATQKNEDGAVNDNSSSAFLSETEAILKVEASTSGTNEGSHSNAEVRSGEQRQQDNDDGENNDDGREDGELPESPSAGARDTGLENYRGENKGREMEGELEEGEEYDEPAQMVQSQGLEQQYKDYQQQLEKYQQYYETMLTATTAAMASLDYIDTFQITDCGSTHGTFLNGERLSVPKAASQPFALKHMDQLRMGSTVFEVHLHEDGRICETCQITDGNEIEVMSDKGHWEGSTIPAEKNSPSLVGDLRLTREQERIEEMNRLKKKWAGPDRKTYFNSKRGGEVSGDGDEGSQGASQYVDRAAKRRLYNPDRSSPIPSVIPVYASQQQQQHQEMAAQTSGFHVPVAHTNKGHAMLSKMGWKAGTGLGVAGQGVVEPIQLMVTDRKAGLGSKALQTQGDAASRTPETPGEQARRKARERYAQLK